MAKFGLEASAHNFAQELTDLLNATVCQGIPISYAPQSDQPVVKVGYKLNSAETRLTPIPLKIGKKATTGYLGLLYSLKADYEGAYLMVESSIMTFGLNADGEKPMIHYDYERDKPDNYPDAHIQLGADPDGWSDVCAARKINKPFSKLHLPVGDKRFRPTVEDFIAFLIRENLANCRPGCEAAIAQGRQGFAEKQLRAAVRRNPEVARAALAEVDRRAEVGR